MNELLLHNRAVVCVWLEAALHHLPQRVGGGTSSTTTPVVTRKQLVEFHQQVAAAESSTDVSHALREFSRPVGF